MRSLEYSKYNKPNIKTRQEIDLIEKACRIVAETLKLLEKYIKPGVETRELDMIAEDYIKSKNAIPAFKGFASEKKVFPSTLCISIDEEVVHGIPSNRKLKEGEIVSIDCGAKLKGFYGDSAYTYKVGNISEEKSKLLDVTEKALYLGIEQAIHNNKVYDISRAVQSFVEENGFSVTRELVGHGVGRKLHEEPFIPNFVPQLFQRSYYPNTKLLNNMSLAIEPMVHAGDKKVYVKEDGWTVVTADHKPAAHFEHTIIVNGTKPEILTLRD